MLKYLYLSGNADKLKAFYDKWGTNLEWDLGSSYGRGGRSLPKDGLGPKLQIPHRRNFLLQHMLAHNPDLEAIPSDDGDDVE